MRNIMPLKWCVFTGALMLTSVYVTNQHKKVTQDPPGVTTRWWDGSLQSRETRRADGKLESRTVYGEDGKTVITLEEWNSSGVLTHSKIRNLKTGRVEEKMFQGDGKMLSLYKLWNADELTFVIERRFNIYGKLESETIMTEDGLVAAITRGFHADGSLYMEHRVEDNADQSINVFAEDGKLVDHTIVKANGDSFSEKFSDGKLITRSKAIRLDDSFSSETFDSDGKLVGVTKINQDGMTATTFDVEGRVTSQSSAKNGKTLFERYDANGKVRARSENDGGSLTNVTVFDGEKVKLRQYLKISRVMKTEEVSTETGLTTRAIEIKYGKPKPYHSPEPICCRVELYRADGTLERVKVLKDDGSVEKTIEYDATGKTVTSEKEGGDDEKIDPLLLQDASRGRGE